MSTVVVLPEGAMHLSNLTKLLPPKIKHKLRLHQCAGCGRMANVGDAKLKAYSTCESVRNWCVPFLSCVADIIFTSLQKFTTHALIGVWYDFAMGMIVSGICGTLEPEAKMTKLDLN